MRRNKMRREKEEIEEKEEEWEWWKNKDGGIQELLH